MSAVTIKSVFKGKSLVELRYELLKIQKQILELRKQQVLRQLADRKLKERVLPRYIIDAENKLHQAIALQCRVFIEEAVDDLEIYLGINEE